MHLKVLRYKILKLLRSYLAAEGQERINKDAVVSVDDRVYNVKKLFDIPVPSRDVTYQTFPAQE